MLHPTSVSSNTNERESYITSATHNPLRYDAHREVLLKMPRDTWSETLGRVSSPNSSTSPDSAASYSDNATMHAHDYSNERGLSSERRSMTFPQMEVLKDIINCDGQRVEPNITATIAKKCVFLADDTWTCYRRNYMSVECSYTMPCIPNARLYLKTGNSSQKQIQALSVSVCAQVGDRVGKTVELVQHTAKRDRGPQNPVGYEKLSPSCPGTSQQLYQGTTATNGPYLPLQFDDGQQSSNGQGPPLSIHTFERIQFKSATANNGKRRAAQQFYHLVVVLLADIRDPGGDAPDWVKIAQRVSEPMVVRGRSPGHYSDSRPHPNAGPGGSAGASGGSRGHRFPSGHSGTHVGGASLPSYSGSGPIRGAGSNRSRHHAANHSPSKKPLVSLAPLAEDQPDSVMTDYESALIDSKSGYQYYPSPISDELNVTKYDIKYTPSCNKDMLSSNHLFDFTHASSACHGGSFRRYHGFESSLGHYPTYARDSNMLKHA